MKSLHTHIFMMKSCKNLYFTKSSLAICLMLKWTYLLDGNLDPSILTIVG